MILTYRNHFFSGQTSSTADRICSIQARIQTIERRPSLWFKTKQSWYC